MVGGGDKGASPLYIFLTLSSISCSTSADNPEIFSVAMMWISFS